ncbi:uncharacterized protein LOC130800776 isoform X3 [Amaranthus tricolor]|uniref:uncharacterized protein LOC130800776 isoform X3 n=1 Tax=Amaranthus tricolor TaxID=29722 RepID=UPI0025852D61|nr:uncharacterized protein LOC130800776 isoform X3 [Amaranthus tricolor]
MDSRSLDILEKKWSRVRIKEGTEASRLYPDGYLELREDPVPWIRLNPNVLQRVRRLNLNLPYKDDVEEVGDSIGELTYLTHFFIRWARSLKCLPNLHVLEIRHCYNLQELLGSLGGLHSLTYLSLYNCYDLRALLASLGELLSLTHLSLGRCYNLQALPTSLGELRSLTHLSLEGCYNLQALPASLGELRSLTHLSLEGCYNLQALPASLGELRSLTHLSLGGCYNLQALPASLGELRSLTHLTLDSCKNLRALPASLGELRSLTHLSLRWFYNLQTLSASLGELRSLTHLSLTWCPNLQALPASLGELHSLIHFTLCYCDSIKSIPNMKVETLYFESMKENHFPSFGKLSNQTSILGLSQIPINSDGMPPLLFLDLRYSQIKHFSVLGNIKTLPKLQILSLPECFRLETLPFDLNDSLIISIDKTHTRKTWKELKTEMMCSFSAPLTGSAQNPFNISPDECLLLNEASMLLNRNFYKSVRLLDLSICEDDAEKLNSIKELSQLTHLYIKGSNIDLKYLPNTITRLRHLSLQDCDYESFSDCLDMLTNLESLDLDLYGNELPENIDVSVLVSLRCLTLRYWDIESLPDRLAKLSNLTTLVLHRCYFLNSLPPDMNLVKLKLIHTFIRPLPTGLRHLEIILYDSECDFFEYYENTDFKELVNLETLSITCNRTKFLPSLEGLLNLQELQLKDCFNLRKMPKMGKLSNVCTIDISGTRIKTLPGCITNLHNLKYLILPKCFKKESLPHNFKKEPVVTIDDIHEAYYKYMGVHDSYYETSSEDDYEKTSYTEEIVNEEDTTISQEGHNTVQTPLHQLQNLPSDQTPVLGASSEFGQAIINNEVALPHCIFSIEPQVIHLPAEILSAYNCFSIDTANKVEGHHSHGRNTAICEDSQHALHSLQNQQTELNKNHQSDDKKVNTQKKDIPREKIQSLMSLNMTIVEAANDLGVSRSTLKRRLADLNIKWPRSNKKICKDAKTTKDDVEPSWRKCSSQFNLVNPINLRDQKLEDGVNQLAALPNNVPFESNVVNHSSNPTLTTRIVQECPTTTQGNMDDNQQDQEIAVEPPHENSSTFVVKATCNGHTGRINFCLTKSIDQLKEEVRNKLELEEDNFFMEYEDEEQEWVIVNSISDLKHAALFHSKSSSRRNVRLRIIPKKSCYSTSMTTPMSQVIHDNFQSDTHLRGKVESSSTQLKSTAPYAPAINKMMTLDCFQYMNYLPAIMHPFLEGWLNVNADGNCGFRVVADAFHGGEDNWAHARRSMYNALGLDTIYVRLYGGQQEVREAMNRILWDNSVESAPPEHWMTSIQDLFVIATFYNCVVIYFSFGATPAFHTILPLRALPGIQRPYGELAIAHCGTHHPHYIRVFLLKDAPLPPIANYWGKYRDPSVEGWVENYSTRLVFWEKTVDMELKMPKSY